MNNKNKNPSAQQQSIMSNDIFTDKLNHRQKTYDLKQALIKDFEQNVSSKDEDIMGKTFNNLHFSDQAILLESLSKSSLVVLITAFGKLLKPEALINIDQHTKKTLVSLMGCKKISKKISELETDDIVDFFQSIKRSDQIEMMKYIPMSKRKVVRTARSYSPNTVGFSMERSVFIIPVNSTVKEAIIAIREQSAVCAKNKRIYEAFVVNENKTLVGTISMETLINSEEITVIKEIMNEDFVVIRSSDCCEEAVKIFNKYEINTAPVLGPEGSLIGSINIDTVRHLANEKTNMKAVVNPASVTAEENIAKSTANRFKWLFINLATTAAASWIISFFEDTIHQVTVLAVLMPITVSMGSNAGTQTVSVIIRAMSLNHIHRGNFYKYLNKEIIMASLNSLGFALLCTGAVYVIYLDLALAAVFGAAIAITLMISAISGVLIPVIMRMIKTDPAITSVVPLTAVVDVTAFLTFLGLAKIFLIK